MPEETNNINEILSEVNKIRAAEKIKKRNRRGCLFLCILAGIIIATKCNLSDPSESQKAIQTPIVGFGGYKLEEKIDQNTLNEKNIADGYIEREAVDKFRDFDVIRLYFTPKTFLVYKIESWGEGGEETFEVIRASIEKKYEKKMIHFLTMYSLGRNKRSLTLERRAFGQIRFEVTDKKLENQNEKEKEEITQSKVDTRGL